MKYNRRRTLNVGEEENRDARGKAGTRGCKVYVVNIREKRKQFLVIYLRARTIYIIPYQ